MKGDKIKDVIFASQIRARGLVPEHAIEYFIKRYVNSLKSFADISRSTLLDCGCGLGWLCFSYVLNGGKSAIGIDVNTLQLQVAKCITEILELRPQIDFIRGSVAYLPIRDAPSGVDVCAALQVLEHLESGSFKGASIWALKEMSRITTNLILINTPNKFFPVDTHDTGLPFIHWIFKTNKFLSPRTIERNLRGFQLITPVLSYRDMQELTETWPFYSPYLRNGKMTLRGKSKFFFLYQFLFKLFGVRLRYFLPAIQGIYKRASEKY